MTQPYLKIASTSQPVDTTPLMGGVSAQITSAARPLDGDVEELANTVTALENVTIEDQRFLSRSISAYEAADEYFNATIRPRLNDSLAAYKSQHTANSTLGFDSNPDNNMIYRPKTRTIINKYKAAATGSFFSNLDTVSIEPENQSDKAEAISAAITKALVQYRLSKSIPWFSTLIGAFDDALTQGLAIAHIYWKITRKAGKTVEKPVIDLVPLENFRFDPSADWTDIVGSSPYLILLKPTYICDLKDQMESGEYLRLSDDQIAASTQKNNTTAQERAVSDNAPTAPRSQLTDYQTCLVQVHIHRISGEDWIWTTLNNQQLLTRPQPLEEVYFDGQRPYVIGFADIEPHNPFSTPLPTLLEPTQTEMNLLANQRRTNIDMALNRKWRVDPEAHDDLDPNALLSNEVGSIVFAAKDGLEPLTVPDVTASSYQEQAVLDRDFAELAGDFQPQNTEVTRTAPDTYRTNALLSSQASMLVEMRLKTFVQTWAEPVLRALVRVEQHYETDETLIGLVGAQAGLFQRDGNAAVEWSEKARQMMGPVPTASQPGGVPSPQGLNAMTALSPGGPQSQGGSGQQSATLAPQSLGPPPGMPSRALPPGINITGLLRRELTVRVNVGMNATDPQLKLARFIQALRTVLELLANPMSVALDMEEVYKEVFALCGYSDGRRFQNNDGENPAVRVLKTQLMQAMAQLKFKQAQTQMVEANRLQIAREHDQTKKAIEAARLAHDGARLQSENARFVAEHSADRIDTLSDSGGQEGPTPNV